VPLIAARGAGTELRWRHAGHHTLRGCGEAARPADRATVKSVVLAAEKEGRTELWLLMLRGDHELNEVKASQAARPHAGFPLCHGGRKSSITSAACRATSARSD
jgi:prolyl-tRNA synthetase